jgi:Divergent InlB B-repeat domain
MKRSYIWLALGALVTLATVLSLPSCGHDQKLVSVAVQPTTFTFLTPDPSAAEQYTAIGTYIHPPATKDMTSQATWKVDDGVVAMASPGLFSPVAGFCGGGNISATLPEGTGGADNIVIGYATVTVNDPTNPTCPGGGTQATLGVQVSPTGDGTVTSLTGGISCPGQCIAVFPVGASVGLVAMPANGHSFLSWTGCTSSSGSNCTVTIPQGGANVLATFQ